MKQLAEQVRNLAGEYPETFNEHNPRFSTSIETPQGTRFRVSCQGDQASILALAERLEKKKPASLKHPMPLPSRVNLGRAFSDQTFRNLANEDPAGAVHYAENMKRQVLFDQTGNPVITLKRPDCLYQFPDLELVTGATGYGVMHLHSGKFVGKGKTKAKAIEAFQAEQSKRGNTTIRQAARDNHVTDFQVNQYRQLMGHNNE